MPSNNLALPTPSFLIFNSVRMQGRTDRHQGPARICSGRIGRSQPESSLAIGNHHYDQSFGGGGIRSRRDTILPKLLADKAWEYDDPPVRPLSPKGLRLPRKYGVECVREGEGGGGEMIGNDRLARSCFFAAPLLLPKMVTGCLGTHTTSLLS